MAMEKKRGSKRKNGRTPDETQIVLTKDQAKAIIERYAWAKVAGLEDLEVTKELYPRYYAALRSIAFQLKEKFKDMK